jgi:hypothetical protein
VEVSGSKLRLRRRGALLQCYTAVIVLQGRAGGGHSICSFFGSGRDGTEESWVEKPGLPAGGKLKHALPRKDAFT